MFSLDARGRRHFCALAVVLLAGVPASAIADSNNVQLFAGGQFDFANYAYIGATVSLPKSPNGNGLAVRGLVDTGGYDYISSTLGTVRGNFGGGEIDGVYQVTQKNFWSNFAVGVNDTYTNLEPYDTSNALRGEQVELRLSLDGGHVAGPWRADWYGYYGPRLGDYAALLGGTHSVSPIWRVGAQVYAEGNPSYRLYQVGPYAGVSFAKDSELQLSAGEAWESGYTPRAYVKALISQRI